VWFTDASRIGSRRQGAALSAMRALRPARSSDDKRDSRLAQRRTAATEMISACTGRGSTSGGPNSKTAAKFAMCRLVDRRAGILCAIRGYRLGADRWSRSGVQSRILLVWTRLIMPNGRSLVLERQPATDAAGYAGLEDKVDSHWADLFRAALLSTLLGVGSELGSTTGAGSNSDIITALRRGSSDSLNQTGQKVVQQNLNIQPTLTIRPGFSVRVMVNRDLLLEPYKN
jgi:hypothetical protein